MPILWTMASLLHILFLVYLWDNLCGGASKSWRQLCAQFRFLFGIFLLSFGSVLILSIEIIYLLWLDRVKLCMFNSQLGPLHYGAMGHDVCIELRCSAFALLLGICILFSGISMFIHIMHSFLVFFALFLVRLLCSWLQRFLGDYVGFESLVDS